MIMPLIKASGTRKLPTLKQFFSEHPEKSLETYCAFVTVVLVPNKFPTWTFITDDFRWSIQANEFDAESVKLELSNSASALVLIVEVTGEVILETYQDVAPALKKKLKGKFDGYTCNDFGFFAAK